MHDWTLISLNLNWQTGVVTISFFNHESAKVDLVLEDIVNLIIPKEEPWGESISVNTLYGPECLQNGNFLLKIEMQSGDVITLEAKKISLPKM